MSKSIRISDDRYELIHKKAIDDERTIVYHVNKAIDKYCGVKPAPKPAKPRVTKPQEFKDFFAAYPEHRRGGTDASAWKAAQSEGLDTNDYKCMLEDTLKRKTTHKQWLDGFVPGITRYIREKIWRTKIITEQDNGQSRSTRDITVEQELEDTSWADGYNAPPGPVEGGLHQGTDVCGGNTPPAIPGRGGPGGGR